MGFFFQRKDICGDQKQVLCDVNSQVHLMLMHTVGCVSPSFYSTVNNQLQKKTEKMKSNRKVI